MEIQAGGGEIRPKARLSLMKHGVHIHPGFRLVQQKEQIRHMRIWFNQSNTTESLEETY